MVSKIAIKEAWGYAKDAYLKESAIERKYGEAAEVIQAIGDNIGDKCFILTTREKLIISFAGSDDLLDHALNLVDDYVANDNGIHDGLAFCLDRMAEEILSIIADIRPMAILVTGHSRGGALAKLLTEIYLHNTPCRVECVAFGSPKIATGWFYSQCQLIDEHVEIVNVINEYDPVPHLPPGIMGYIDPYETKVLKPKMKTAHWARLLLSKLASKAFGVKLNISHHTIKAYDASISNFDAG